MDTNKKAISAFRGLNNVVDPLRLSLDWAVQADNINVTSTAGIERCAGYTRSTTNTAIVGAYATNDLKRMYVIDSGELRSMNPDLTYTVLKTGMSGAQYWFTEINNVVYYSNGVDFGMIEPAGWRQWGIPAPTTVPTLSWGTGTLPYGVYQVVCTHVDDRGLESGNSDIAVLAGSGQINITAIPQKAGYTTNVYATMHDGTVFFLVQANAGTSLTYSNEGSLEHELPFWGTDVPRGTILTHFQGQMYGAEVFVASDYSVVWNSMPLHYHHFDYGGAGLVIPGVVRMLASVASHLIVGTDREIYAFDGEKLEKLADYGVVAGWHAAKDDDQLLFWSLRGLCSVMPFRNWTEEAVSVPPGARAGGAMLNTNGMRRYVVALLTDGQAYNRR
jgi:hypothetical protein